MAEDAIDRELLKRLAAGDAGAFDLLIGRHEPVVRRQARRLLAWRTDVDDVVQEVFLALWRGHGRFRGESALGTWLLTITIRECRRKLRREFLWDRLIGKLRIVSAAMATTAAGQLPADSDDNRRVVTAVTALPAKLREVVVLHYLEGFAIEEVARTLGLKRSVVDVRLTRARQKLAETLKDDKGGRPVMNEKSLAETLAKIDQSRLAADDGARKVCGESIKRLHSRRRTRERSFALASVGIVAVVSTLAFRIVQERDEPVGPVRSVPIVTNDVPGPESRDVQKLPDSKPDFELARVANPAMNFELELVRESIAESLVRLARLRKAGGTPETDWRQDLDFVLKNYPATIAAETARAEFGTVSETNTN